MWHKTRGEVLENREVAPGVMKMLVLAPGAVQDLRPGQFFQVRWQEWSDPFLRRPLSAFSSDKQSGTLGLLFRVVGRGTSALEMLAPGSHLDLLGPLGNGWPAPERGHAIMIAGGIGVAPLVMAAREYAAAGVKVSFLLGATTRDDLLATHEIEATGASVSLATDDGTEGHHGFVTGLLPGAIVAALPGDAVVLACGPGPMLRAVQAVSRDGGVDCFVSLEQRMGCGVGACLGCVVRTNVPGSMYKKVCADGPVFDAKTVVIEDV